MKQILVKKSEERAITLEVKNNTELVVKTMLDANLLLLITHSGGELAISFKVEKNSKVATAIVSNSPGEITIKAELSHGAEFNLGAATLTNTGIISIDTEIKHAGQHSKARINTFSALKKHATASLTSNAIICKKANGTDTFIASHALLLDKTAKARTVPSLEIQNNNVKAGHSASTSKLSEEDIFYCTSRGISEINARKIITSGFLHRAFRELPFQAAKLLIERHIK